MRSQYINKLRWLVSLKKFLLKIKKVLLFFISALILPENIFADKIPNNISGLSTIKNFLATAMQPVGNTLYIWGGGWNSEDTAASETARHIGIWPQWKEFFDSQDLNYNFLDYAISENGEAVTPIPEYLPLGLDCSGYLGWLLYNVFHNKNMEGMGYVSSYTGRTNDFVDNNWGTVIKPEDIRCFKAGDIMNKEGHVYIVIGQCDDGSVVFVHSSPPGVHICGTVTPDGNEQSEAVVLAESYMKKYYPEYDERYSRYGYVRSSDYLTQHTQLRWNTEGAMKDPDGYIEMTAEQILKNLFDEKQNENSTEKN